MKRSWTRRSGLLALALLALAPLGGRAQAPAPAGLVFEEPGRIPSDALLGATLYDLDNRATQLAPRAARPLIVNFWARWCGPCQTEIPELVALRRRHAGVDVVGINIESDPAPVGDFARAYDVNYPVLLTRAAGLELMRSLGNGRAGLPFTVVLDRRHAVVATRLGVLSREQLDAAVQRALR